MSIKNILKKPFLAHTQMQRRGPGEERELTSDKNSFLPHIGVSRAGSQ